MADGFFVRTVTSDCLADMFGGRLEISTIRHRGWLCGSNRRPLTGNPARPPRAPASSVRTSVLQILLVKTSRPWTGRGEAHPAFTRTSSGPKRLCPQDRCFLPARDLEDCGWPVEMGLVIPSWDTHQLPGPPSMSKTEDTDHDDLTALDLRWRASWYIADFHQFLLTSLERLNSRTFSQGDPVASTRARASQTRPREG